MIRSHSLPLLLSSLSMRSAKFGQGTNSNFMLILVWAVKSLDSSTSALAGSQAAQHKVMVLPWADAVPPDRPRRAATARLDSAGNWMGSEVMEGLLTLFDSRAHISDRR